MEVTSLLVVLGVLVVFGLIVLGMIQSSRRKQRDRLGLATILGFEPLALVDHARAERLIKLHQHSDGQELKVENIAQKIEGSTTFLIFDLIDYGGDSVSTLVDTGIAVFSQDLALPRFSLIPRVAEEGRLAEIANKFLEMLVTKRADRIVIGMNEFFDERYFLLGEDEGALRAFLDGYRQSRLGQEKYRHLEAEADCFTYSRFVFSTQGKRNRLDDLKQDLAETRVLLNLFS